MRLHLNPINARRNQSTRAAKEVGGSDRLCVRSLLRSYMWRETSRSTSAYILRAMYGETEDKCDLIIFTQCYLLREAYLCALCVSSNGTFKVIGKV